MTQEELSALAGVSIRTIRDIERDRVVRPQRDSLRRLRAALGTDGPAPPGNSGESSGTANPANPTYPQVSILGPLAVVRGGEEVVIGSPMRRRLIGLLALRHPHTTHQDEIIDVLWPDTPPRTSRSLVHVYISQLRALLRDPAGDDAERIVSRNYDGYRLHLDEDGTDLVRFDELAARAVEAYERTDLELAWQLVGDALKCWRGQIFDHADPVLCRHPDAVAATSRRLAAALTYGDVALAVGHHTEAINTLRGFAAREPLHEGLHARLMLALACRGDQAGALGIFADIRSRLDEQLGVEPGAQIRAAHLRILRQELPEPAVPLTGGPGPAAVRGPVPGQLPADTAAYTGRAQEVAELDALLLAEPATPAVAVLVGPPGVGKTALALRWAHRVRDSFPAGQLFVDLRGDSAPRSMAPVEVLGRFLRSLGVPAGGIPADTDEAAGTFRTMLAGKRMLIVLDNAFDADQVRPLLPGEPGCVVLVTSRRRLSGLVAMDGAHQIILDVLGADDAQRLLARLLGADRVAVEPDAVARLASICGRLPLAIRIAAANLVTGPRQEIHAYCAQLNGGLLENLEIQGDKQSAVRAAFDQSYLALPAAAQRMFRLLGLVPGQDVTADAAAALAGTGSATARAELRQLVDVHLVEEHTSGRFALHDLLRRYAADLAGQQDGPDGDTPLVSLAQWYLGRAGDAAALLYPEMLRVPSNRGPGTPGVPFTGRRPALTWLDTERANLVALITRLAAGPLAEVVWRLADVLHGYLALGVHTVEWLAVAQAGLAAAEAVGDALVLAAGHLNLAGCHWARGDSQRARRHYATARNLARQADWPQGEAAALSRLGIMDKDEGRVRDAAGRFALARRLDQRSGRQDAEANHLVNLGLMCFKLGMLDDALGHYRNAAALAAQRGSVSGEAIANTNLATVLRPMGRAREAAELAGRMLAPHRDTGNRGGETIALCCVALSNSDLGMQDRAVEFLRAALAVADEIGERRMTMVVLNVLGAVLIRTGDLTAALDSFASARGIAEATDDLYAVLNSLIGRADAYRRLGDLEHALADSTRATGLAEWAGFRMQWGRALGCLADVRLDLGDHATAEEHATAALALYRQTGHRPGAALAHVTLGGAASRAGRTAEALSRWRRARAMFAAMYGPGYSPVGSAERDRGRLVIGPG